MSKQNETVKFEELDEFHRALPIPSIEDQFRALPPSRELVEFYRNKLSYYEKYFSRMTDKVDMCKRTCLQEGEIRNELRRCSDEVFTLQKALSDTQVFLHRERNRVLSLHSENEVLKIQMARDRKMITFLLSLCGTSEDQVSHLINEGEPESSRKTRGINAKEGLEFSPTEKKCCETNPKMLALKVNCLEAQLRALTTASQDEIHSLHQDREVLQMEKEEEYQKLQNQISVLTNRLSRANVNICELTSEIITLKKNFIKKEEKWILEKEREKQSKNSCGDVEEMPERFELKSKLQKESMFKVFKGHLQNKDKLVKLYKDQCVSLENELWELNNSKDKSTEILQAQVEKMNDQLVNMKEKYQKLLQKRNFEAEGFKSDVKILKGRLQGLERKVASYNYTVNGPERKELIVNARETLNAAKCLEKELCMIKNKMMRLNLSVMSSCI
ncbi:coiled-coil domain-containing protein 77-like isoform X2 [Hetaerina americana]|uniref:coiled-coil domain-containing protein 77-like isoform X2 n=1 Tax=Hetaerina americana TaxID=62018 RepID=UPI003A7F449E